MAGAVAVQVAREEVFENFGDDCAPAAPSQQQQQPQAAAAAAAPAPAAEDAEGRPVVADARSDAPREEARAVTVEGEAGAASPEPPTDAAIIPGVTSDQNASAPTGPIVVTRHTKLAPYKPGKMTVVLDMDECLLHSKFHGPGAASEAYRQLEERPDAVNEVNSFWVALDDGDTAQVRKNMYHAVTLCAFLKGREYYRFDGDSVFT